MARGTHRTCFRHCRGISCTIATIGMLLVWVHAGTGPPSYDEPQGDFGAAAIQGVIDRNETPPVDAGSAGRAVAPSPQAHGPRGMGAAISSAGPTRPQTQSASPVAASTETRLALVIGNGRYAEAPLQNPLNDARAMERSLRDVGFAVVGYGAPHG